MGGVHHEWTSLKNSRNPCRKKTLHPLSGRTHFTCMVIYSSRTCQITLYTWIHIKRIMVMISTHHHQLILFTNHQSSFRWTLQHLDIRSTKIGDLRPYPEPHGSVGRQAVDKNNDLSSPNEVSNEVSIKEKTSGNCGSVWKLVASLCRWGYPGILEWPFECWRENFYITFPPQIDLPSFSGPEKASPAFRPWCSWKVWWWMTCWWHVRLIIFIRIYT